MILILTVNFPFLDGDVPRRPSNGVYISQLTRIRFARVCSYVTDLNARDKRLTAKHLQQGYRPSQNFIADTIIQCRFENLFASCPIGTSSLKVT